MDAIVLLGVPYNQHSDISYEVAQEFMVKLSA